MGYLFEGEQLMEYKIITETGITLESATEHLAIQITSYLKKDWKLQGGVIIGQNPLTKQMYAAQVIVKEVE